MLMLPLVASAQNPKWRGASKVPVSVTDTIIWADKFNNGPFSLDVDYSGLNHAVKFAVVVSNRSDGSFGYYKFSGVIFPVTLDPVTDVYAYPAGVNHANWIFKGRDIAYFKFGIMISKLQETTGIVNWSLKQ